ncbi:hypothetical protein M378DRAFT_155850 [Amanita muscaria Koide BX008]|uniref:Uncharacterized protein n=1 Tax=Amanita muscaria (strain Koide BX008) TaxID=946122 RepID=A0A0C2XP08_AMAMK|nr:hypothetical protein M378DRAFT_155850 [Amanita muscaria Koide BX008]
MLRESWLLPTWSCRFLITAPTRKCCAIVTKSIRPRGEARLRRQVSSRGTTLLLALMLHFSHIYPSTSVMLNASVEVDGDCKEISEVVSLRCQLQTINIRQLAARSKT